MGQFVDAVLEFNDKALERADLVLKYAAQDLSEDVTKPIYEGGRMRVDTGFLRASFRATLDVPILTAIEKPDGEYFAFDSAAIGLTINRMTMGQTLYLTFTANYARHREYGARGQAPDAFVRTYTADWQGYVNRAAERVKKLDC